MRLKVGRGNPFQRIHGNARIMLLVEPMWAIPAGLVGVYASLYMSYLGLSPAYIGLVISVGSVSGVLFSILGGHITDRMGRRTVCLVFDLIGASGAILIWMIAQNFWYFIAAAVLSGVTNIVALAWNCQFVEDTAPEERITAFSVLQAITISCGFFVPLAGLAVAGFGLVPAVRLLYGFYFLSATLMFILRYIYSRESAIGQERMRVTENRSLRDILGDYLRVAVVLVGNRTALLILLLNAVVIFRETITNSFGSIFLNDHLGIPDAWIAVFPTISAVAQLLVLLVVTGVLRGLSERTCLRVGLLLIGVGQALLIMAPVRGYTVVGLSTICSAMGIALLIPAINAAWNNSLADDERAKMTSVFFLLVGVVRLPAGWLGGILYEVNSLVPFLVVILLVLVGLLALRPIRNRDINERDTDLDLAASRGTAYR